MLNRSIREYKHAEIIWISGRCLYRLDEVNVEHITEAKHYKKLLDDFSSCFTREEEASFSTGTLALFLDTDITQSLYRIAM